MGEKTLREAYTACQLSQMGTYVTYNLGDPSWDAVFVEHSPLVCRQNVEQSQHAFLRIIHFN